MLKALTGHCPATASSRWLDWGAKEIGLPLTAQASQLASRTSSDGRRLAIPTLGQGSHDAHDAVSRIERFMGNLPKPWARGSRHGCDPRWSVTVLPCSFL